MFGRYVDLGNPVSDHPINNALIGCWLPLPNNKGGTRVFDLSRNAYHGVLGTDYSWSVAPNGMPSIVYPNSGEANCGAAANLALSSGFTLSCYFTVDASNAQWQGLMSRQDTAGYTVYCNTAGDYKLYKYPDATPLSSAAVTLGRWTHFVFAVDTNTSGRFYVDGVETFNSTWATTFATGAGNFYLGKTAWSTAGVLYGKMNAAMIHKRAVSSSEAKLLYQEAVTGFPLTLRRFSRTAYFIGSAAAAASVDSAARRPLRQSRNVALVRR